MRYFKESEFHEFEKMNKDFLKSLDTFRHIIKTPVIITSSTDGVHAKNSQHYLGRACDVVMPNSNMNLLDLFLAAVYAGFTGIGIYPHWQMDGEIIGGLHLDNRVTGHAFWLGVKENGRQKYVALNLSHLKKYGVV